MSIWALCHVSQMLFVIWWGKLPSQAGVVWLREALGGWDVMK